MVKVSESIGILSGNDSWLGAPSFPVGWCLLGGGPYFWEQLAGCDLFRSIEKCL
ncbi:hypothetical protein [Microcoleus sp. bin38.metabat.b11b12b14.051]|uniref:hypothetical protein n=1 Tax=Microcoleus sp. bin38.metabat.b11b12b14.051 TaxID=2742709 RepID=UPI0025D516DE|nr:hypothetical protein [Microcoleus sp. bin38.metabat.b11b12b14.051]